MAAYDPQFTKRPELVTRKRLWTRTLIFTLLAVVAVGLMVHRIVDFESIREAAAHAQGSRKFVAGQRLGAYVAVPFLAVVAAGFVIAAVRWGRGWFMTSTGTRLRLRAFRDIAGGLPAYGALLAGLRTGDPSMFTPWPPKPSHSDVSIEIWIAEADRVGFVTLVLRQGPKNKPTTYSEPVRFEGASFDALTEAVTRGFDEKAPPLQR